MRALVTGGAGFIGSHVTDALVEQGAEVVVLDDLSTGFADNVNAQAELIEGDVADHDIVAKAVAGCEVFFTRPLTEPRSAPWKAPSRPTGPTWVAR